MCWYFVLIDSSQKLSPPSYFVSFFILDRIVRVCERQETSFGKISHKTNPTICHNYTKINDNLTFEFDM